MRVEKSWGYEEILQNGAGGYCMKLLVYTRPIASSYHYHEHKHETFYIASGWFEVELDGGRAQVMGPYQHVVIPPEMRHRVRCTVPGTIVEASSFDDPNDCIRLIPSET